MREPLGPLGVETESPTAELRLLITPEPWFRVFLQNVRTLFQRQTAPADLQSSSADFWPDVFVERKLPWGRFFESGGFHILALAMIWAGSRFLALQPEVIAQPTFTRADVIYYTPSEYLPPLDTRRPTPGPARKADPESGCAAHHLRAARGQQPLANRRHRARHPIAARCRSAQHRRLVGSSADADCSRSIGPASEISRLAPQMERSVIAPPPDIQNDPRNKLEAPQSAIIAPPPSVDADSNRRLGELNIAPSTVIAPAPQLSLDAQRTMPHRSVALDGHSPRVIAPPPSVGASGGSRSGGDMVALSLHPAVGAPPAACSRQSPRRLRGYARRTSWSFRHSGKFRRRRFRDEWHRSRQQDRRQSALGTLRRQDAERHVFSSWRSRTSFETQSGQSESDRRRASAANFARLPRKTTPKFPKPNAPCSPAARSTRSASTCPT